MTNYVRGRAGEYSVMKKLREAGWLVVRSSGSHTPIDLLASKQGRVQAIQVKTGGKPYVLAKQERDVFTDWAFSFRADPILASRVRRKWVFTQVKQNVPWDLAGGRKAL